MPKLREAGLVLGLVLGFVAGCGADGAESGALRIGDQKGNSRTLLAAAGLLADFPHRVEWSTFTSGPPLLEAASAGAIDVGAVGNTPPIFAAAADAKIAVVQAAKGSVEGDAVLVPGDSPLRRVEDLAGRGIAVAKGSSAHGQLLTTLTGAGLTTRDVELNFLQPSDAYAAFQQKRVDAWAVWDPYTSQALLETGARVLADGRGSGGSASGYTFYVAGRSALGDNGKTPAMREFLSRVAKAQRWADTHREEWAKAWAAETGLKVDVARAATARGPDLPVPLDAEVVDAEQRLADAFTADGTLPGRVDFAKFVDTRFQDARFEGEQ
ncbi:aliphatic sulfonate ABC transporter substrate-binding protein [Saccharothrix obliqua]|uniref:aliphatic sulfonate ABC transporter substrate-binding protein n=1 Tax=Saccharothrix obliqua TaxID=2861747 RepID=UPI001C5D8C7D|nr:aliphatic sulfonate ABC transporter substrate-binding protein [Saccharothrix obliqua]MBW4715648.1 aliphatic sulfonate ABC transporter substrate-binding protein [Saccharothrix obliqua]